MCVEAREGKRSGCRKYKITERKLGNKLYKSVSLKHDTSHKNLLCTLEIFKTFSSGL